VSWRSTRVNAGAYRIQIVSLYFQALMGLYDSSTVSHLRPWLIKALEPMYECSSMNSPGLLVQELTQSCRCDADPEVLSDYVLALLKHDAAEAELRTMFVQQLQDFLETGWCD
jgi:RNA-binding protein 26